MERQTLRLIRQACDPRAHDFQLDWRKHRHHRAAEIHQAANERALVRPPGLHVRRDRQRVHKTGRISVVRLEEAIDRLPAELFVPVVSARMRRLPLGVPSRAQTSR